MRAWRAWARSPVFLFAAMGGVLFAARTALDARDPAPPSVERPPIVVSAERARALEEEFRARWGAGPDDAQRRALIEQVVQEEMLYREARVLALGLEDGSVRRRLLEKMRALGGRPGASDDELVREAFELGLDDDVVIRRLLAEKMRVVLRQGAGEDVVTDAEVRAYVERHREELLQPETLTLAHVFFSPDVRGESAAADARATLARLRAGAVASAEALASADPFPLGHELRAYSRPALQGRFGKAFAETVFALPPGEWSEPIASPFGLHLVRIEERTAASLPPLEVVRPIAVRAIGAERARLRLARGLARLRELYEVRMDETVAGRRDVAPLG